MGAGGLAIREGEAETALAAGNVLAFVAAPQTCAFRDPSAPVRYLVAPFRQHRRA